MMTPAASVPATTPDDESSLADVIRVCASRWRLIAAVTAAALALAIAWLVVAPPRYRASAKILVTSNRADVSSPRQTAEVVQTTRVTPEELNSQLQILESRDLLEQVLRELGMTGTSPLAAPSSGLGSFARFLRAKTDATTAPLYVAVSDGLAHLDASVIEKSNVLEVDFSDPDPARARNVLTHLVQAYLDRHVAFQQHSEAEEFFTTQSEMLRKKLSASEAALADAKLRAGALPDQDEAIARRVNFVKVELGRVRIARAEAERRAAYLESQRAGAGKGGGVATPELLALEAKRADLAARYQPESQQLAEVDAQITRLRTAVASYDSIGAPMEGRMDLFSTRAEIATQRAREEVLNQELAEYLHEADGLAHSGLDDQRLERQVRLDEEAYLSYVRSAEDARLSGALEKTSLLRLRVIELAPTPLEPVGPPAALALLLALAAGLVLGVGTAIARERLDSTVRTAADVRRYANLDVLAIVPDQA
jgi:uncharacterized protein involved in exopolysaccharide biosynthesis